MPKQRFKHQHTLNTQSADLSKAPDSTEIAKADYKESVFCKPEFGVSTPLLRWCDVLKIIPVGKSTIQRWMLEPDDPFPHPKYIKRTAFFSGLLVSQWLERNLHDQHGAMVNFCPLQAERQN